MTTIEAIQLAIDDHKATTRFGCDWEYIDALKEAISQLTYWQNAEKATGKWFTGYRT